MSDVGAFISEHAGALTTAGAAYAAVVGTVIAGHIQGRKALKGAEAQAKAALEGAQAQANKALEAAQEQARAALEVGRQQVEATLAGIRETSKEGHAQWQRDRCQEVWAEYVKELDLLLPKVEANNQEARSEDLLKAYAMVELMSPPNVLAKAREAKDGALDFTTALYVEHIERENCIRLARARRNLGEAVAAASRISQEPGGRFVEQIQIGPDDWDWQGPGSQEEFEAMSTLYEQGCTARAALEALDEAEQQLGDDAAERRAHRALVAAGVSEEEASLLARAAGLDRAAQGALIAQKRSAVRALRDVFVEGARMELDALGR
ncbi:hypothetical protein ACFXPT_11740 [Streptomyces goshikiensis]|uniref:hypothetical protein n=1 Tax=Streptomyces goshikiensis TaxID=1942 RepID=UPI0036919159